MLGQPHQTFRYPDLEMDVFYTERIAGFKWEPLAYFVASVVWRAAITDWKFDDGQTIKKQRLHPDKRLSVVYLERLREYLLNPESGFPEDMTVVVYTPADQHPDLMMNFPQVTTGQQEEVAQAFFVLPGFSFFMELGPGAHNPNFGGINRNAIAACSIVHGKGHPLLRGQLGTEMARHKAISAVRGMSEKARLEMEEFRKRQMQKLQAKATG